MCADPTPRTVLTSQHLLPSDRQIGVVSNLTNAANSIVMCVDPVTLVILTELMEFFSRPPLSWYTRKPVVVLPSSPRVSRVVDGEQGSPEFEDSLDRYVDDILKRPSKIRRTLLGIWSFLKTRKYHTFFITCTELSHL